MMPPPFQRGYDYIGVSAVALIHDGHGALLLQQRGTGARDEHGHWDLCGGAIEFGETIEVAIRREVQEELSAPIVKMEFLTVYDAHRLISGKPTHWIAIVYAAQVNREEVLIAEPDKITQIGWFTSAALPVPLHSQFMKSYTVALAHGIVR
jgi:8-oxo-dGTP diphosphatase